MSSIVKRGKSWRASVKVGTLRETKTHRTRNAAQQWAADRERELQSVGEGAAPGSREPFREAMARYAREVASAKRGARWETVRVRKMERSTLADCPMDKLSAVHIAAWRDARLREVSASTVLRELNLLSHICTVAVSEWHWLKLNPCKGVRRPQEPPARDRRISSAELDALKVAAGYEPDRAPVTPSERVGAALLLAIETGLRAGELCALRAQDVIGRTVRLHRSKNGLPRDVPLSREAERIIRQVEALGHDPLFDLTPQRLDGIWRKLRTRACVTGLHFHDSRHEAITRLSKKLDVLALARMVGHRDIRQLQRYYNPTAEELAERLG